MATATRSVGWRPSTTVAAAERALTIDLGSENERSNSIRKCRRAETGTCAAGVAAGVARSSTSKPVRLIFLRPS